MGNELALTTDMIMVLSVLGLTIFLFVFEILRVDVVAICIMVLLGLLHLLPADELFNGFASNAVISIIAVMIIGAGLDRTGAMNQVASFILKMGGKTESRVVSLVSGTVGVISGFMQNVGATALFLPVMSRISTRSAIPLSRLLMPMGFCAIMGGTLTMVGSSPLILLNDLIENSNRNLPPGADTLTAFTLFSVTPIGLALLISTILYFLLIGRFLLPRQTDIAGSSETTDYFASAYQVQGELFELTINADSDLVGQLIGEAERHPGAPVIIGIKTGDDRKIAPYNDTLILVGSVLAVMGQKQQVREFAEQWDLTLMPRMRQFANELDPSRAGIAEVVVKPGSSLAGQSVGDVRFRKRYGMTVLALQRSDQIYRDDIRHVQLAVGDTLVVHGFWRDLATADRERDLVIISDFPKELQRPHKVLWALFFFTVSMLMIMMTDFKLSVCLLVGAMGMILTGVINMDEAYGAVSWKTVFLLASLIPLGLAMDRSGTAAWMAQETLKLVGDVHIIVLQALIALLATFFTLVMSNVGATTLLVPLAINIALAVDGDPAVFALIVAISASNAFLIPTHQVSALIMGPGNYRVVDFLKVGSMMTILFMVISLTMINLIY